MDRGARWLARAILAGATIVALLSSAASVGAQAAYPSKPIQLIIPFAAGSSADIEGRIIAKAADKHLGQPVVAVNEPGAGGALAYAKVKTAAPDGYTVSWNSTSLLTTTNLGNLDFDYTALVHVCRVSIQSMAIAVKGDAPWKSFEEFIAYAKANPGKVKVGNAGTGSGTHLTAVAMGELAGLQLVHVPLGAGKRIPSLLRGEVEAVSVPTPEAATHHRAGQARILAVASGARDSIFPDVPTMKEKGVPVAIELFRGISVPKGTPPAVIQRLADAFKKAGQDPTFVDAGKKGGFEVSHQGPEEFSKYLAQQNEFVASMMVKSGLKK